MLEVFVFLLEDTRNFQNRQMSSVSLITTAHADDALTFNTQNPKPRPPNSFAVNLH